LVAVDHPGTGFDEPGYNYGFMTDGGFDGQPPRFIGHGGSGPGFRLMALVDTRSWQSAFDYSEADFDQTRAIIEMRARLARG
jgi:hypothetical protein